MFYMLIFFYFFYLNHWLSHIRGDSKGDMIRERGTVGPVRAGWLIHRVHLAAPSPPLTPLGVLCSKAQGHSLAGPLPCAWCGGSGLGCWPALPQPVGRAGHSRWEAVPPSPVTPFLTAAGGERGKGHCETSVSWRACVCISLSFPRNEVSVLSPKS